MTSTPRSAASRSGRAGSAGRRRGLAPLLALLAAVAFALPVLAPSHPKIEPDWSENGRWVGPFDGEVPAVNMVVLADGRVLYWSGVDGHDRFGVFLTDVPHDAESRVLDPATLSVTTPTPSDGGGSDLFCSANTHLPDGQVLVVGGTDWKTIPGSGGWDVLHGTNDSRLFSGDTWTATGPMEKGRWYPSLITLPDGTALVASGIGELTDPQTMVEELEVYDPASGTWTTHGDSSSRNLPMYPRLFVVPSGPQAGGVLYQPVGCLWCPFGERADEGTWSLFQTLASDGSWTTHGPSLFGARQHAASVMLALRPPEYDAHILTFGGTLQRSIVATGLSEITDLTGPAPVASLAAPLADGRWHPNGVLLPTGEVLAVGGGGLDNVVAYSVENPPVFSTELFDPTVTDADTGIVGAWTIVAPMTVPRMYHSTAALLPDGRVLAGGHVPLPNPFAPEMQVRETRFEVYEPPYLFRGDRPDLSNVPVAAGYGEEFDVTSGDAANVKQAVLMRPGATTHSYDMEERLVELEIVETEGSTLTLAAPPNPNLAPPGPWMLFLLADGDGGLVPSEAGFIGLS